MSEQLSMEESQGAAAAPVLHVMRRYLPARRLVPKREAQRWLSGLDPRILAEPQFIIDGDQELYDVDVLRRSLDVRAGLSALVSTSTDSDTEGQEALSEALHRLHRAPRRRRTTSR